MEGKICLKLNEFQAKVVSTFKELRQNRDFSDVTLVSEDGQQIEAHRSILSSSCPFFMNLLAKNLHPHPMLIMTGVESRDLIAIVDFLYSGELVVESEDLDSFLALAKKLKLTGLTRTEEVNVTDDEDFCPKLNALTKQEDDFARDSEVYEENEASETRHDYLVKQALQGRAVSSEHLGDPRFADPEEVDEQAASSMVDELADPSISGKFSDAQRGKREPSPGVVREHIGTSQSSCGSDTTRGSLKKRKNMRQLSQEIHHDLSSAVAPDQVDALVKSMIGFSDRVSTFSTGKSVREKTCKVCGRQGLSTSIARHIERNHIVAAVPNFCEGCKKIFGTRAALKRHKSDSHCMYVNRIYPRIN